MVSRALLVAVLLSTSAVRADTTQPSPISQMMVLEPADASYKLFHGAIWLDADKAAWNYRWGGLQCKGRELSDTSVQLLFAAFRSEYLITAEYVVSEYKGKTYRCITGFTVSKA
jgi:hypothetical protein